MTESEWKRFLADYNRELLSYEEVVEALPRKLIATGSLGHAGVTVNQLASTERRLATRLPPSYRTFLKVSNGWRFPSASIFNLLPADNLNWFRDHSQDWVDAYAGPAKELPRVSDKDYFVYGAKQDCVNFRAEYLETALQISDVCDGAVVLLNPKVVTKGEWETWFFANWLPGAVRYRSFAEWLAAERKACRQQLTRLPKAKVQKYVSARKPVSVRKAQAAARSGKTKLAVESLEAFATKGDDSAAASLAELYAFLGQWDKVIANAGRLIANPAAGYVDNVFCDMIRLLGRAGHRSGNWASVIEVVEAALKANTSRHTELHRRQKDKSGRDFVKSTELRYEKIFRNLVQYAKRHGTPPHELLAIFGVQTWEDNMSEEERKAWFDNAVRPAESLRPDLKKNPQAKMEHLFSLAKGVVEDEAVKLYETHGKTFSMAWEAAEYVAPVYMRRKNPEAAWKAIASKLKHWWPVAHSQVAPVVLLIDEDLQRLMTPERCKFVLSTPRGPEAAKAAK